MKTRNITSVAAVLAALSLGTLAHAAGGDVGEAAKQSTNWTAIVMFGLFVAGTLWITKWAAAKTRSAADFYTGGGEVEQEDEEQRPAHRATGFRHRRRRVEAHQDVRQRGGTHHQAQDQRQEVLLGHGPRILVLGIEGFGMRLHRGRAAAVAGLGRSGLPLDRSP